MELAHLHGTLRYGREQPRASVANDSLYLCATGADDIKPFPVCGVGLAADILPLKHRAGVRVLEQHHPEATSKIGRVHDDDGRIWR